MESLLLTEQEKAKKEIDNRALMAFGLVIASFVVYPFVFAIIPDGGVLPLLVLLGWPIAIGFSFFNVAKTVRAVKYDWLKIQAQFVQRWLEEVQGFKCRDASNQVDTSLVVGQKEIIKDLLVSIDGEEYGLILFKDEVGDKKKLNFYWYASNDLKQQISGTTYLVAETDFSHKLFKQFETSTTLLEWGQFEDLLHVETTNETEARYLLPPDVMEKIYNSWLSNVEFLGRVKFSNSRMIALTGLKGLKNNDESKTLLHDEMPEKILQSQAMLSSLIESVPSSR